MAATHAAAFERGWTASDIAGMLAGAGCFATGTAQAAFALTRVVLDEAELLTIATRPDQRRRGLARAALEAALEQATEKGATRFHLEVAATNAGAIALYETAGFARTGLRRGYYRDGTDALLMSRALP